MIRFALFTCALAACVHSNKVVCGDLTCPPDYTCDAANERCISPDQIAACADAADGADCVVDMAPGTCRAGACEPLVCGDGLVSGAEQCDGTSFNGATCKDFRFYDEPGLACTAACTIDVSGCTGYCGDGQINGGELCDGAPPPLGACFDFGYDAGPLGCSDACGGSYASCAHIGWQIEPTGGVQAYAAAGTAHDDDWIVGAQGAIVHFNGVVWSRDTSPVTNDLVAVTAIAPGDAWAVGLGAMAGDPGVVLHRDATRWQVVATAPTAQYLDIWATSHDHVFAATTDHEVLAWDGTSWQQLGTLGAGAQIVRGTSPSDLWAVRSSDHKLWHWDGTSWAPAALAGTISGIAARAPGDVWAIGQSPANAGLIAHWDGATWTSTTDVFAQYSSVAASGPKDVWVSTPAGNALHFDGAAWSSVPISFEGMSASVVSLGPDEAFAFTISGFAYRYTGQAFATFDSPVIISQLALWSSSGSNVYMSAGNAMYQWNGDTFVKVYTEPHGGNFNAIAGSSATNVWALAPSGHVYQFNGAWSEVTSPSPNLDLLLWVGASDVWTFGNGVAHHGPPPWTDYSVESASWISVSGEAANDIWGIQRDASLAFGRTWLQHWDGSAWHEVTVPAGDLRAVGARAANDVFVSTLGDHILHWDGSVWSDTAVTTLHPLQWIVPFAADDVFAASDLDIFHFDGARWSRVRPDVDTTGPGRAIVAVTAPGPAHFQYLHAQLLIRDLIRTKPWVCRAAETSCDDGIDDDCDGTIDRDDSDCP